MNPTIAKTAGYHVATTKDQMFNLSNAPGQDSPVDLFSAQFDTGLRRIPYENEKEFENKIPHLSEMAEKAIELLSDNPNGFFLLVEGGLIDWACHDQNMERMIAEVVEFSNAVQKAEKYAETTTDATQMIVVSDHETGGLSEVFCSKGNLTYSWTTHGHKSVKVPLYMNGDIDSQPPEHIKDVFGLMCGSGQCVGRGSCTLTSIVMKNKSVVCGTEKSRKVCSARRSP